MTYATKNPIPLSDEAMAKIQICRQSYGQPAIAANDLGHFDIRNQNEDVRALFETMRKDDSNITLRSEKLGLAAGDTVRVISGHDANMVYTIRILGFASESVYLQWDCYWTPVRTSRILDVVESNFQA